MEDLSCLYNISIPDKSNARALCLIFTVYGGP